jgi:predicted outer membrane protein
MNHLESAHRSSCAAVPVVLVAVLAGIGACSPAQPPPSSPPTAMARPAPERTGSTMMQPGSRDAVERAPGDPVVATNPATSSPEGNVASLDDAHLAALVQTANDRAIRVARLGESRVTDREVKRLAHDVATSHLDAQNKLRARLAALGIEPASSTGSDQMHTDVGGDLVTLQSTHGKAFDSAYVDAQVRELGRAVELIDRVAEHIKSPELKEAVEGMRSKLEMNMRLVRSVREAVRSGTTNLRHDAFDPDKVH